MNGQVKITWRMLLAIAHSLMVHARVSEAYIHFALMYMADNIFLAIPFKYLRNKNGKPTMPSEITTGTKPSVSHLRMLFCPCVVRKATAHVVTKALNMSHQAQNGVCGVFVAITQHQKGYLVYVPQRPKILSSYDVFFK